MKVPIKIDVESLDKRIGDSEVERGLLEYVKAMTEIEQEHIAQYNDGDHAFVKNGKIDGEITTFANAHFKRWPHEDVFKCVSCELRAVKTFPKIK